MNDDSIDFRHVRQVRRQIAALEAALVPLYAERLKLVDAMTNSMGQREVGAYWGISNPRVCQMLKKARQNADPPSVD